MIDERKPENFIGRSARNGEERSSMPESFIPHRYSDERTRNLIRSGEERSTMSETLPFSLENKGCGSKGVQSTSGTPRGKKKKMLNLCGDREGRHLPPRQSSRDAPKPEESKQPTVSAEEPKGSEEAVEPRRIGAAAIAEILMAEYDFGVKDDQLYVYGEEDGYWKMLQESESNREIRRLIPHELRSSVNRIVLREVYEWIRTDAEPLNGDAETRKNFINLRDCAVDWHTREIAEKRRKLGFTYALKVNYKALCKNSNGAYQAFLQDVFGADQKTKREFRKFIGLCLSDIRHLKVSVFLYGPPNSGKTVVLNSLKALMGKELCASLSFAQMGNEFAITQLLGKRLNLSGEVSGASNKRLDIFKSVTGNDTVTSSFKGKDHFQFESECLMVFACNSFPPIQAIGEFESFLARITIFPFANSKPREQWTDGLETLLLEDSYEIIKDAMKGLKELEEDGFAFKDSLPMWRAKEEFIGQYNSFALFARLFIEIDADSTVTSEEIRKRYSQFCKHEEFVEQNYTVWGQYLTREYPCIRSTKEVDKGAGQHRIRAYRGIRLKEAGRR